MRVLPSGTFFKHSERSAFWLLLGLHLVPIWAFRYFASTDGPAHLFNAWALKTMLLDPKSQLHTLLAFNLNPEPNYLSHGLLATLLLVLPPWLAEKFVLTLYVAGLPLAVRYLVRSWQPAAGFLAVLAFPLIYSMAFQWGFYNFCLSLVILLLSVGYWKRHLAGLAWPPPRAIAGLTGLLCLGYLAHPLAYLTAGLLLGLLVLEQLAPKDATRPWLTRAGMQLGPVALAFLPTLPLLAWYFWRKGSEGSITAPPLAWHHYLTDWLLLEPLRYMGSAEHTYRLLVAVLLASALGYAGWQHWRSRAVAPAWAWLVAGIVLMAGYLLVPDALAGGSIIRPRLGLLSYLVLLGGLATVPYVAAMRWPLLVGGTGVALAFLGFRFSHYRVLHTGLDEYRSAASHIRPGSTIAPLQFAHVSHMPGGKVYNSYIDAFGHAAGYLAVERQLIDYENYEAQTGYFPLVWRPGRARLSQFDSLPNQLDVAPHPGDPAPDYVLVWGAPDTLADANPNRRRALAQLARAYQPVYRSASGLVLLFARRDTSPISIP